MEKGVGSNITKENLNKTLNGVSYGFEYVYTTTYTLQNIDVVYTLV